MKKILVIRTSPNMDGANGSLSSKLTDKVLASINSEFEIIDHNLDKESYFKEIMTSDNFSNYFDEKSDALIKELFDSDIIIFSTPTINFGIPALLKNYFDKVLQASKTFKFKYDNGKGGSKGLLEEMNKRAIIINTQGSPTDWYPFTSTISQIEGCLKFIGINDLKTIIIHGTKTREMSSKTHEELIKYVEKDIENIVNFIEKN